MLKVWCQRFSAIDRQSCRPHYLSAGHLICCRISTQDNNLFPEKFQQRCFQMPSQVTIRTEPMLTGGRDSHLRCLDLLGRSSPYFLQALAEDVVLKVLGIVLCMAGNAATLLGNDSQANQKGELSGDILCLIAAMLYAVYTTVLSSLVQPQFSMAMLFGVIGLCILLLASPFVFAFKHEALSQMTPEVFGLLIFNGLFDNVLSQFAWAKAVQLTSPTTATVGLSLTIPLSVLADVLRQKYLTPWTLVAALLVISGFLSVTYASKPATAAATPEVRVEGGRPRLIS
ncbi:unnamed protein product [Cladocopium goreaui]|uniref:Uncharacterized vacuolar membrane protein YML018C n=1 Tax=Cladocopium goreaui TaxID=2562237 RepID=A0A9P1BIJ8_9DINO|nr:unnamed protein product [Cladocopium goreaui]